MKSWLKWSIAGLAVLGLLTLLAIIFPGLGKILVYLFLNLEKGVDGIKTALLSAGSGIYFVYTLVVFISGILPTPDSPFIIAGGAVFGFALAFLLTSIANIAGFLANYFIAKALGRDWLHKKFPQTMEMIEDFEAKYGWQSVLIFRLAPILPFDWVSYVAGLSKINFWHYCIASYIGNLPGIVAATMLGAGFGGGSLVLTVAALVFLLIIVIAGNLIFHSQSKLKYQKNK